MESHRSFLIGTIPRYLGALFPLSYLSSFFISVMITDLFLQVFLYLFHAGTHVYISCTEAQRTREVVFTSRMYVAITTPYPWDRGVTYMHLYDREILTRGSLTLCNAPIPQVRGRYGDVHKQGGKPSRTYAKPQCNK